MADKKIFPMKVLIVGDINVGKTTILVRYVDRIYNPQTTPTIGIDYKTTMIKYNDEINFKLTIWDSAGLERYRTITNSYYRGTNCIILVYDVGNKHTFDNIDIWMDDINPRIFPDTIKVIVGNKIDKITRTISTNEGEAMAQKHSALYFETTVYDCQTIDKIFQTIVSHYYNNNKNQLIPIRISTSPYKAPITNNDTYYYGQCC